MEADTSSSLTRLHITPLDPDLLKVIVPAAALPSAKNISFHTLEAFPERRYGFVDLPTLEADKIKKKLNGAVLKGVKIRIEKARPDKMPRHDKDDASADTASKKRPGEDRPPRLKEDSSKKRKRQREEIPGVELEEGRRVKRGWTATEATESKERKSKKDRADKKDKKDKKDRKEKKQRKKEIRSRYTDAPECLIKTVVPTAAAAAETDDQGPSSKKRKSKSKTETVVIHEFENTTKFPTFLKNSAVESSKTSATNEFVDGVGWISQDSKIVEAARSTRTSRKASKRAKSPSPPPPAADDTTSSSGSDSDDDNDTSSDDDDDGETDAAMAPPGSKARPQTISIPDVSSPAQKVKDSSAISKADSPRPKSAGSVMSLTIKIPPSTPATPKVHPLEALYKRSKSDGGAAGGASATPAQPSFAFFDAEGDQADEEHGGGMDEGPRSSQQPPMTPYTRQDMEFRNIRSAAPTPDTAHHSRSFKFWPNPGQEDLDEDEEEEGDDGEEEGDEDGESGAGGADGTATASSDFQKWFWENRGDLNRSWKKRRKLAAKEKRYRENRSRANRAV
ncbi:hypothetical protein RB595_006289 [Gaeumannomyces hyphopodioides]